MPARVHLLRLAFACVAPLLATMAMAATARAADPVDWSAWEHLPVYDNGRIMPLNTFANSMVETVCGREAPTLRLVGALSESELESPELAGAKTLFPDGQERKFHAPELLLSWIVEPQKWEHVPFLIAEHDELRSEVLDVPMTNEEGEHLKYVSPAQVAESVGFSSRVEEILTRRDAAREKQEAFTLTGVDAKVDELFKAYLTFRQIQEIRQPNELSAALRQRIRPPLEGIFLTWQRLEPRLGVFQEIDEANPLAQSAQQGSESLSGLAELYEQPDATLAEFEAQFVAFRAAAEALSRATDGMRRSLAEKPPAGWTPERAQQLEEMVSSLARDARQLTADAEELREALYQNDQSLRVAPALNAAALDRDRDTDDESKPWLDLRTLVAGSPTALAAYPEREVAEARRAFNQVAAVFPERATRPNDLSDALGSLGASLRSLGEAVEPLREKLPIKNRDEEMIRYTAYPPEGYTDTEVRYAKQNPFASSWMISLLATTCFVVYLIGFRSRWLFWGGVAILIAGLAWAAYGFAMRVMITGWAPVTNMYETVVYVPFVVSLLGLWFLLLPMNWSGLKNAWRMSAIPGTWEAKPLDREQQAVLSGTAWSAGNLLMLLPRIGLSVLVFSMLAVLPYAAGGRTVINLLPNVDTGASLPDGNDLMTWFVGWCVLVPAVWYMPRVVLAGAASLVLIPLTLLRSGSSPSIGQVYARWPFALAATSVAFLGACLAWFAEIPGEEIEPLQPVLRDNFWLLIHVLTIVASYAAGALAWGVGNIALLYYLFGRYRQPSIGAAALAAGHRPAVEGVVRAAAPRPPAEADVLAGYVYKAVQVAVVLLAAGTILGALWADVAWGRFWGWDPKEVWALISFLVYLAILHGRYAGLFGNFGLVVGSTLGATAIIMSWYGVNFVLGVGLHSYGFGTGGQFEVMSAVLANWGLVLAASIRYLTATRAGGAGPEGFDDDGDVPGQWEMASSAQAE